MAPSSPSISAANDGPGSSDARHAYVTFLAGSGDYIKGAIALAKSLRRVKSVHPLVVAVLDDVPEEHCQLLRSHGCLVRPIQRIKVAGSDGFCFANPHYVINYSKLAIWLLEEFEKMIYLDADVIVYDNIDHLLDLPCGRFYAVLDCFCEASWSQSLQYKVKYCQQCPERNAWPSTGLGLPPPKYFNAGVFLFEPSKVTFDRMMVSLLSTPPTPFAEQDFLNSFFGNIFTPIPVAYNLITPMLWRHPEKVDLEKVKVVHYCAEDMKPWRYTGKEHKELEKMKILMDRWWNVYDDKPLDYPYWKFRGAQQQQQHHQSLPQMNYPSSQASLICLANSSLR